jgi:uncharacterized tellurite resistance protein B-like protein
VVEVRWSGQRSSIDAAGQIRQLGPNGVSTLLLVLGRQEGTISPLDGSISSAHCPNCGAPQEQSTNNACQSCGTVLNDGRHGWVLLQAETALSAVGQRILTQLQAQLSGAPPAQALPPGNAGTLAWLVQMATADGQISPEETQMLQAAATKWGVPQTRLAEMLQAAEAGHLQPPRPRDAVEARAWLAHMARASLADGKLAQSEYTLLLTGGEKAGLVAYDVKKLLSQTRAQLYAESRAALRDAKQSAKASHPVTV